MNRVLALAGTALIALLVSACAYDYLQHSDRIAYSSGDAVRANIERETTNPSPGTKTGGLGKDGPVGTETEAP